MIIATIFLLVIVYFVYQYFLQRANDITAVVRLLPTFFILALLLAAVGIVSLSDTLGALNDADRQTVETVEAFDSLDSRVDVLVVGLVGSYEAGAAAIEVQLADDSMRFVVDLERTVFRALDPGERLRVDDPIVIVLHNDANVENGIAVASEIYAGEYDNYVAFAERTAFIPAVTAILSFVAALMTLFAPLWRGLHMVKLTSRKNQPTVTQRSD